MREQKTGEIPGLQPERPLLAPFDSMDSTVAFVADSTLTLVGEAQKCSDIILDFDRDDAHNVAISLRGKDRALR